MYRTFHVIWLSIGNEHTFNKFPDNSTSFRQQRAYFDSDFALKVLYRLKKSNSQIIACSIWLNISIHRHYTRIVLDWFRIAHGIIFWFWSEWHWEQVFLKLIPDNLHHLHHLVSSPEKLSGILQSASTAIPKRRVAISVSKISTADIVEVFNSLSLFLKNEMDVLMLLY
jgi:hypothetical protein